MSLGSWGLCPIDPLTNICWRRHGQHWSHARHV